MHRMPLYVRQNYLALMERFWATIQATGMEDDDNDDDDGIQIAVSSDFSGCVLVYT